MTLYGFFYRSLMKLAHKYHWHYAPPIYPEGDTQLWCKWCGFRETIKRRGYIPLISNATDAAQEARPGKVVNG